MRELSTTQKIVLELTAKGLTNKEICFQMSISPETLKGHLLRLRKKLGARNTTHAVAMYESSKRKKGEPGI